VDERILEAVGGAAAYVVGGAVRDELLGRPVVDLDVACPEPESAARRYARTTRGALFPLSERHGAWRVALRDGRTVDFTPLRGGIEADLATRDFTVNAIAVPVAGGEPVDPFDGRGGLAARLPGSTGPVCSKRRTSCSSASSGRASFAFRSRTSRGGLPARCSPPRHRWTSRRERSIASAG